MSLGRSVSRFTAISVGVVGGVLVGPPARAEDPPPVEIPRPARTMTIAESLAYAHEHQPAIHAALSRISARMAEASIPSGRWLPTVAVTAQLYGMTANNTTGSYLSTPFMDLPRIGGTASQSESSAGLRPYAATLVGAGLLQEVFDFGRIGAERAAADELVTRGKASRRGDAAGRRLRRGGGVLLGARGQGHRLGRRRRPTSDRACTAIWRRRGVDSGLRSPIELTRAEADLARFDVGRVKARGGLALAQSVLAAAIGAPDPAIDASEQAPAAAPTCRRMAQAVQRVEARDPLLAGGPRPASRRGAADPRRRRRAASRPVAHRHAHRTRGRCAAQLAGAADAERRRVAARRPQLGRRAWSFAGRSSTGPSPRDATPRAPSSRCGARRSTSPAKQEVARVRQAYVAGRRGPRGAGGAGERRGGRARQLRPGRRALPGGHRQRRRAGRRRGPAHRRRDPARAGAVRRWRRRAPPSAAPSRRACDLAGAP